MKKILAGVSLAALALGIGSAGWAANPQTFNLVVIIATSTIDFQVGPYLNLGTLGPSLPATALSNTLTAGNVGIRNIGTSRIGYSLKTEAAPTNWTQVTDLPGTAFAGNNRYRVSAIFNKFDRVPALGDFLLDDVLTTSSVAADASHFACAASQEVSSLGQFVPQTEFRNLFVRLDVSPIVSPVVAGELSIGITITAAVN